MDEKSQQASTPLPVSTFQVLDEGQEGKVPSPVMESDLKDSEESVIMPPVAYEGDEDMSLDTIIDTSIDTQAGTSTEAPTIMWLYSTSDHTLHGIITHPRMLFIA